MPRIDRAQRLGKCVKCERRNARFANGTCTPCNALVVAENIKLPNRRDSAKEASTKKMQALADEYNKLVNGGLTQVQVAKKLGYTAGRLNGYLSKARRKGILVVNLSNKLEPEAPLPIRSRAQGGRANEHGGGKWGVANCRCEPCLRVRRDTYKLYRDQKRQGLR